MKSIYNNLFVLSHNRRDSYINGSESFRSMKVDLWRMDNVIVNETSDYEERY